MLCLCVYNKNDHAVPTLVPKSNDGIMCPKNNKKHASNILIKIYKLFLK